MANTDKEVYDLLILVDATYSMFNYLESLQTSLPKIIQISLLTDCFERIGLLAYRDYSEDSRDKDGLLEWSGWMGQGADITSDELMRKARGLEPIGGGDFPEATKTGLAKAHQLMRADATTVVLLYTDATPHIAVDGSRNEVGSNQNLEQENLTGKTFKVKGRHNRRTANLYQIRAPEFADWVSAATYLRNSEKKVQVFSFLDDGLASWKSLAGYYVYLSSMAHGACFHLTKSDPNSIAAITVDVLLAWMGVEKAGSASVELPANLVRYVNGQSIRKLKNESDEAANDYFWATSVKSAVEGRVAKNMAHVRVTSDILKQHMPKKRTITQDFAQRYKQDRSHRQTVREQITRLIESDVTAFSLNPVFGSLWRAVCNDREYEMRDALLNSFSVAVDRIANADEKGRMKAWLEESYDYAAEIAELVESVPAQDRYPCLFLDPTLRHGSRDEDGRAVTDFRRDELLEIGRSCDYRILRRLGKVLTELTYVDKGKSRSLQNASRKRKADVLRTVDGLPEHVHASDIPLIPLCLGQEEHGLQLFRVLLHVVVPGTMLGPRASAVLAALAIKMGIKPLAKPASELMLRWKNKWNDLENPETWNTSCLSLLIDADSYHGLDGKPDLLGPEDKLLFEKLVAYKLTEANLQTSLTARVGWTPDKTSMAIGPTVICRSCEYPRSVTIMAEKSGGVCGLCVVDDYPSAQIKERYKHARVTKDDSAETQAIWVECSSRECRAQYVVYNTAELRVRPKCHYCRQHQKAPLVECTTCLNRLIWPKEYWTSEMRRDNAKSFQCVLCSYDAKKSIVEVETSAQDLIKENGGKWLLENGAGALKEPFSKRSLFHVASTTGPEVFLKNVNILPDITDSLELRIKGKVVRNVQDMRTQLRGWIDRRQAETVPCSLCFSDFHRSKLRAACGRRGCDQHICESCLKSWYGTNSPGHIINPATLTCPFCRRAPAAKTLAAWGMGIHAVRNLAKAVEERGTWIYAWCTSCSAAQQYLERSCARGAPPEIADFVCEPCIAAEVERLRIEEQAVRLALAEARRRDYEWAAGAEQRLREAAIARARLERPAKNCPKCKVPTQKTSGCDHLTCYCGAHWCWSCGKQFDARRIYEHMNRDHGTYYGDDEYDDDDEY